MSAGDLPFLRRLRADTATQHLLMAHPGTGPGDDDAVRRWIERRQSEAGGAFQIITAEHTPLGFIQIVDVHGIDRYASLGICLDQEARGRGVGEAAMRLAMVLAAGSLGLRKLLVYVRGDNEPALRLYARLGFREVGSLSRHYIEREGQAYDAVLMECFLASGAQ